MSSKEIKEIEISIPTSASLSDDSTADSTINDSPTERVVVEPYDEFAEPIEVISRVSSRAQNAQLSKQLTGVSLGTTQTSDPSYEIDFEPEDTENPKNWPVWRQCLSIFFIAFSTLAVVLYSTSYTAGIPGMMEDLHIKTETVAVLGLTTYLIGLASGSLFLAPLSEMYGRRPVYLISVAIFAVLIIPCGLAKNLETILIARYFGAFAGAVMISNAPGSLNDIVNEEYRALAFSCFAIGPMNGPVIGPLVGGFIYEYLGWRWTNWIALIVAGFAMITIFLVPETYAPAILRKRAEKRRKETGNQKWWSRYDEKKKVLDLLKINLSRPFIMSAKEPICIFWNLYIGVVYAILYLCFVAYPIIFAQERGWKPGFVGLAYCGIGIGSLITIALEPVIRRVINSHKIDPQTGRIPPEAMISVVCVASLLVPIGEITFAWTCTPNVHWIAPIIAGIPFGAGNTAIFIYASNYLVHSYGIYAASALAGNSVLRSLMGGLLPLAGPAMYSALNPNWAGTLLACLEFCLVPIPFVFYRYGNIIRKKSTLIAQMQADQEKLQAKKRRQEVLAAAANGMTEKKLDV